MYKNSNLDFYFMNYKQKPKLNLVKSYEHHEDEDKNTLIRAPSPLEDDDGFAKKHSDKQKKQRSSGRVCPLQTVFNLFRIY